VLFLDEIGSLSLSSQAKLLKVIETKSYYAVGSNEKVKVNFTLITATWENLYEKTKNKEFRLDLLQRIMQYQIEIPPLHSRKKDLQLYIKEWMTNYPRKFKLHTEVEHQLLEYNFPGNFRELNALLLQISQTKNGEVTIKELNQYFKFLNSSSCENKETSIDLNQVIQDGIKNYLLKLEKKIVMDCYERNHQQVTAVLRELKLSPSSFYRITQIK
jgi:transcriptional regulator with PAS, ATPase and Fis domain